MPPPNARERIRQQVLLEIDTLLASPEWPAGERAGARAIAEEWLDDELHFQEVVELFPVLLRALAQTADPAMALRNWNRYARVTFNRTAFFHLLLSNAEYLEFLASLFAFSQFFSDIAIRNPEYLDWCLEESRLGREKELGDYRAELHAFVRPFKSVERRRRALCRYKRRELMRIGVRDLRSCGSTAEHCRELSNLAEAACELAFMDCVQPLLERYGVPAAPEERKKAWEAPVGFGVFAMGKFGGRELNFSSDIDLLFVYDVEGKTEGRTDSTGHTSNIVTNHEFYSKLANAICLYLSDPTNEGILYRVDTRLRPDGASGAIARALPAYSAYFAQQARSWEKIAYAKARCVAGDRSLAPLFEERCHGFVFAANDPDVLLPEVARLKRRIDHEALDGRGRRLDIKRGTGGIREIEFFVAALQLLLGGREKALRVRPTLEALEILAQLGKVPREEARQFEDAYWLFRRTEHVLQMMEEQQTHTMPEEEGHRRALARRLGFERHEDFERVLQNYRAFVRARFEDLFHEKADQAGQLGLPDRLLSDEPPSRETLEELQPYGLGNVEGFQALRELAVGTSEIAISSTGQRRFEQLLPMILAQMEFTAMPVVAVRNLASLMRTHHSVSMLYELILAHPPVLKLLVRSLGFGLLPSRILIARPDWLDEILGGGALAVNRSPRAIFDERLAGHLFGVERDDSLRQLRQFKEAEALFLSIREILAVTTARQSAGQTTELAEVCLGSVAELAAPEWSTTDNWCVLAFGSFGARETHVCADLDVAFFFDATKSKDPGAEAERLNRIATFIMSEMSAVAPECQLWKMDARLRPDGRSAPLVVSLERAARYYREEAGIWELQSATRARFAAGNPEIGARALAALHGAVSERGASASLAAEVRAMRARMESAFRLPRHALYDLKRSPGGLVDIEFLVQYFQLCRSGEDPALLTPDVDAVLERLAESGALPREDAAFLGEHHRNLRHVQRTLRLLFETSKDLVPEQEEKRAPLRRALAGQGTDAAKLLEALPAAMERTRALFDAVLGAS
ncbi:MAG: [glutamine synthetase] adenylyltransferase / [glutamine synthetase]-adenylyl-L-tyrosine [Candidatus Sumerlaeota bacterium]|nr:[glutamine synthetase] adenylyltransferase / [glutamine synthetase]-adenylyl-L-tyrosine [Candidatus Sumerlaeota bacterium]